MKLRVDRRALVAALKTALPAVPKAGGLPVLNGVLIDTTDGVLVTCSNLDLTISTRLDTRADDPGVCVAPAALLARVTAAMPGTDVELVWSEDSNRLTVTSGDTIVELSCMHVDEWPKLPTVDGDRWTLTGNDLADIARIVPCASTDLSRPVLCAVVFDGSHVMATDSFRLGVVDLGGEHVFPTALVPAEAVRTLIAADVDEATLTIADGRARFTAGATSWTVRLVVADPISWRQLVRDESPASLSFDRDQLADAVHRLGVMGHEQRLVRIQRDGMLARLATVVQDVGTMTDTVPCEGDFDALVAFNGAFLSDLLDAMGDTVTLELVDAMKPAIARNGRVTHLLMPVKVDR